MPKRKTKTKATLQAVIRRIHKTEEEPNDNQPKRTNINQVLRYKEQIETEEVRQTINATGDKLEDKKDGIIRFALQNPNGIKLHGPGGRGILEETAAIQRLQIDVAAFPECNLSSRGRTREVMENQLSGTGESVRIVQATARSEHTAKEYQPGGVLTAFTGKITGRVLESHRDPWGRFSWTKLRGDRGEGVCSFTVYRVSQTSGTGLGAKTAYKYQVQQMIIEERNRSRILQEQGLSIPMSNRSHLNPRKRLLEDLAKEIQRVRQSGYHILMMMDANEDWTKSDGKQLKEFMQEMQLCDPLYDIHYDDEITPTYARGSKRIDYILMDECLVGAVHKIGTLGLHEAMFSDHVMVYVDIIEREAFEGKMNRPVRIPSREFILAQTDKCVLFLEAFKEQAQMHQFQRRAESLRDRLQAMGATPSLVQEYNNLDRQIQDAILFAAKKTIKKKYGYCRSLKLGKAGYKVSFWKSINTMRILNMDIPESTKAMARELDIDLDEVAQMSNKHIRMTARDAVSNLREVQYNAWEEREEWVHENYRDIARARQEPDWEANMKKMLKETQERAVNRKLTGMTKGAHRSLDWIEVPIGTWFYSHSKKEIYKYDRGVFECYAAISPSPGLIPDAPWRFYIHHHLKVPHDDIVRAQVEEKEEMIILTAVEQPSVIWRTVNDTSEIEKLLLERNSRHLRQAEMEEGKCHDPLIRQMKMNHGVDMMDEVLSGTIDIPAATDEIIVAWIRAHKQTEAETKLPPITGEISTEDFQKAFAVVSEHTSSSPSGLHYFPGDLQSNFDRMLPSFNSIISMKYGMTRTAARCRAATVAAFKRNIRTAAGTSKGTYQYESGDVKLGGEIQGKPDNMQLWAMESSLLLKLHQEHCRGVELKDPEGIVLSRRTGDAYVDDKDTLASAPETNTIQEGVENMQHHAQFWAILITLVGQAFAFHKCFWQGLSWMALGGYYIIQTRDKFSDLDIWIEDHRGKASKIAYRHHDKPNDGLGLRLCPTANQTPEFEKRLEQATRLSSKVKNTSFKISEAWITLRVCVLAAITYPFALTRFTKRQLGKLNTVIEEAFLPKLGINRKMNRVVLRAPVELGGIALPNMEKIQYQKGITNVMRQLQLGKEIATDLRILIAQAQLDSGLTNPILDDTSTNVSYIEPGMIMHLHDRLAELEGSIVLEDQWCPKIQRVHDISIMKKLSQLKGVKPRELQHANQCRKYMRVITIAEMASLCGTHIKPDRFNGRWRAKSRLKWNRQPPPTGPMWDTFRRLIKRAFCTKNMNRAKTLNIPLDTPLGSWYNIERHIEYEVYRSQNIICKRPVEEGPSIFERFETVGEANYFKRNGIRTTLVHASHPTSMTEGREGHYHPDHQYNIIDYPNEQQRDSEEEENIEEDGLEILRNSDTLIACSDGSYDPLEQKAAFNWRIVTADEKGLTSGSAPVNTNPKYLNSYRAEFAGLRGAIQYMKKHGLHRKDIILYCDGKSCVDALNSNNDFTSATLEKAESDIIQATQKIMKDFSNLTIEWVKGHQDDEDDTELSERPLPVRLNKQCDLAAKECLRNSIKPSKRAPPMEGAKATLYLGMNMVTTEMAEQIHYEAEAPKMLTHVQNHLRRTKETVEQINWRSIGRFKKRLKLHESIRMTKMMYGWLNVGSQKVKMGQIGICPCCGEAIDTQHHLYTCPNELMRHTITETIKSAKSTLVRQGIPSSIYNEFVEQLCLAVNLENPDDKYSQDPELQHVRDQQSRLGEEAFMKGFLHKEWTRALNERWTPAPPTEDVRIHQKDALEQTVCLQRVLWDIFETQWACRNDILHGKESKTLNLDTEKKTNRLLEFREKRNDLLRRCDHWMIDYPQDIIVKWSRNHKIRLLQNLERLKRIYDKEKDKETATLRPITDFFQVVTRTTPGVPAAPAAAAPAAPPGD